MAWLLVACSGDRAGVVIGRDGNPAAETVVKLLAIDDTGEEISTLESTVTDFEGHFVFTLSSDVNASVVAEALLPGGVLRGFYAGSDDAIPVHPLTEALVTLVTDITTTDGGRSLDDFSATELRSINNQIFGLDASSLELTDDTGLENFLRTNVGRTVAESSGGEISGVSTVDFETPESIDTADFAQDLDVCPLGANIHLLDGGSFRFDVEENGSLCGGSSPSLTNLLAEGSLALVLPHRLFFLYGGDTFPNAGAGQYDVEGGRELSFGPYSLEVYPAEQGNPPEEDTLSMTRKVYVAANGDVARYLEIFTNSGGSDRTVSPKIESFLLASSAPEILAHDLSSSTPSTGDRYVVAYDPFESRPVAGFLFQDGLGEAPSTLYTPGLSGGQTNEVSYFWSDLTVPAGGIRTLVHYVVLSSSQSDSEWEDRMRQLAAQPDMSGMSLEELAGLANFAPGRGTVTGEAGAVIGLASLTGLNVRSGQSLTVSAHRDGSFAVPIDALSGDTVALTASDGLSVDLAIP